ncbi:MAG: hypothetical protein ACRD0Z_05555 [Acidimicrobiales bacterium]
MAAAYDPASAQVIAFGGVGSFPGLRAADGTWDWNGKSWVEMHPKNHPAGLYAGAMAYDPQSRELVMFGGDSFKGSWTQTWLWSGSNWTLAKTGVHPPGVDYEAMAYDAAVGGIVFCCSADEVAHHFLWSWKDNTWSQLSTGTTAPPNVSSPSMTYDPSDSTLLLFGGYSNNAPTLKCTGLWMMKNQHWSALSLKPSPSLRLGASFT